MVVIESLYSIYLNEGAIIIVFASMLPLKVIEVLL